MPLWTISFANLFDRNKRKSGGVLKQVTSAPSTLGKVNAISPEKFLFVANLEHNLQKILANSSCLGFSETEIF